MQRSLIGVGPALRKARHRSGVSVEEAARDTRIRPDLVRALEEEAFEALLGDVYVRGALRTYAQYLGLSPEKVVGAYARGIGEPEPPPPPPKPGDTRTARTNRPPRWGLAVLVAGVVLVLAAAFGILSGRNASPPTARLSVGPEDTQRVGRQITASLEAVEDVDVEIRTDGVVAFRGRMVAGEGREFAAAESLRVEFSRGGLVHLTVSGVDHGLPGSPNRPYSETFSFDDRSDETTG